MLTPEVRWINSQLLATFGRYLNKPKFRIVWSGDQFEKRLADYEDWKNDVLVRRVKEVREVPKYPYINPPWWLLERTVEFQDETVKDGNNYEPLYLFRQFGPKGEYLEFLPPRFDMAKIACEMSLVKRPHRTVEMDKREFEEKETKGEKDIYEQICDQTSYMAHKFHHGEAIVMPGTDTLPTSPNLRSNE